MKPNEATWYCAPATEGTYARPEFIYSGAVSARDADELVATLNRTDPGIKATSHTGPNYAGFHQVNIGNAAAFRRAFSDLVVLPTGQKAESGKDHSRSGKKGHPKIKQHEPGGRH